jgi:hypothetical protein
VKMVDAGKRATGTLLLAVAALFVATASVFASDINGSSFSINNNFNINGTLNPLSYGAVSSTTVVSAATTIGSAAVILGAAGDFQNGQAVVLPNAGPLSTISPPTWCTTSTTGC